MVNDSSIFTLASICELPITGASTLRIIKRRPEGGIEGSLFVGTFLEFQAWLARGVQANPYAKVQSIVLGNGNSNALIII
jgi:hypothetical protein